MIQHGPKTALAAIDLLNQYASPIMKKYICILAGAALLVACEQKTETVAPVTSPTPTTPPPAATDMSPAATEAPATTTESPAGAEETPAQSPAQ
jgi:PBP1b-binding outer membrane lipoprotein LpoB